MGKDIVAYVLENQNDAEDLRRSLERIIQLYTDKSHFIYELLQNAEDANAKNVKFIQYSDRLELLHDGSPFTRRNLSSLCSVGASDKIGDLNKIGEFGVGFKSVFCICETVQLYSNPNNYRDNVPDDAPPFAVEITGFRKPEYIDACNLPGHYTTKFVFPYCVGKSFSSFDSVTDLNERICERLENLEATTLLFMKRLESIEYEIALPDHSSNGCYMRKSNYISETCRFSETLGASGDNEEDVSYLIFSKNVDDSARTIDIAFPVSVSDDGRYVFTKTTSPYVSVYFPTGTESKLPFVVQGPYRTTPNRSEIPEDNRENHRLAELTAELLYDSVLEIKEMGQLSLQLLSVLPLACPENIQNWLFQPLYDKTVELFQSEEILPCCFGGYTDSYHAVIARRNREFADLFRDSGISALINEENDDGTLFQFKWLPTDLTAIRYEDLHSFLISVMDIQEIRLEYLAKLIDDNPDFLPECDDDWIELFYAFLEEYDTPIKLDDKERNLLDVPIVKTTAGGFIAPYNNRRQLRLSSPNVFLPGSISVSGISYVAEPFATDCREFLAKKLGLKEPNQYEFFRSSLQLKYKTAAVAGKVSAEENAEDVKRIIMFLKSTHREDIRTTIEDLCFLRCKDEKGDIVYINPFSEWIYFPTMPKENISITEYFRGLNYAAYFLEIKSYVAFGIEPSEFKAFKVKDTIVLDDEPQDWHTTSNSGRTMYCDAEPLCSKLTIDAIDDALSYIRKNPEDELAKKKSKTIFAVLLNNLPKLHGEILEGKVEKKRIPETAKIIKILVRSKWLFDKDGKLVRSCDVTIYNLDDKLYDITHIGQLSRLLEFKIDTIKEVKTLLNKLNLEKDEVMELYTFVQGCAEKFGSVPADVGLTNTTNAQDEWDCYSEFPCRKIRNIDLLRKHISEQMECVVPVEYKEITRSIRVSMQPDQNRMYLRSMYSYDDDPTMFACQMCQKPTKDIEATQIEKEQKFEIEQMHLCLCPSCAAKYRRFHNNEHAVNGFIESLSSVSLEVDEPIRVNAGEMPLYFTATHLAEIQEILKFIKLIEEQ